MTRTAQLTVNQLRGISKTEPTDQAVGKDSVAEQARPVP
jgi:hypothetical protein